jgi:hypothetical protein
VVSFWLQIQRSRFDSRRFQIFEAVGLELGPLSLVSITEELLEEIVAAPVKKTENTSGGISCADHATPSIRKSWYYFAKKRRSLGRRGSLADQSHGVFFIYVIKFVLYINKYNYSIYYKICLKCILFYFSNYLFFLELPSCFPVLLDIQTPL